MNASSIFFKTIKFVWLKLALGLVIFLITVVSGMLFLGLCALFQSGILVPVFLIAWVVILTVTYRFAMSYAGYMLKAAHVAVISRAVVTGSIPDNMVETGKQMVIDRFVTVNAYYVLDRLVSGSVNQINHHLENLGNFLSSIPGIGGLVSFAQTFVRVALGNVDECCLGYTFCRKDVTAMQAACDGIVIYWQNKKTLMKDAAFTALFVMLGSFIVWLAAFALFGIVNAMLGWSGIIPFVFALIFAAVVKSAFIDSYVMVRMMVTYMSEAPSTVVQTDLYGTLCKFSAKFRKLFQNAKKSIATA